MAVPQTPLACVIFDVDGTLARTNELIFASFNHVAQRHLGRTFAPPDIVALFGPPEEGALRKLLPEERVPAGMDELCAFYRAHHERLASVHDGVIEILRFLKGHGLPLAVFTGKGRRTTGITLEVLGLSSFFDLVVSGDDVVRHKPDPEGIRTVLAHFGVPAARSLMVGDAMTDVRASRDAGVRIASVLWDSYDRDRVVAANAGCLFERPADLLAWLRTQVNGGGAGGKHGPR